MLVLAFPAIDCVCLQNIGRPWVECSSKAMICNGGYDEKCDMLCLNSMMCNQRLGNSEPRYTKAWTA